MSRADLEKEVQNLSPEELCAFAKWFEQYAAGLSLDDAQKRAIREGVRRMEDVIKGQTAGLSDAQFRRALG